MVGSVSAFTETEAFAETDAFAGSAAISGSVAVATAMTMPNRLIWWVLQGMGSDPWIRTERYKGCGLGISRQAARRFRAQWGS
ncbi:hypothetical protein Mth01_35160 [Sphaerimonospora thailandensis]|uniref:Uncharacterized protein n=1 Tax=Sphaerimonospora thailandensis TaxID=795644 RepID=A0A8J3RF37_9ACTN|nr:hypothetical protein Mth01_35160 [Sphaerimonospora thailandensis]